MQKYKIRAILGNVPKIDYPAIIKELESRGISRHNIYQWGKIKASEKRSMPLDQALDFAEVLGVDVNDIHNRVTLKNSTASNNEANNEEKE